MSQVVVFGGYGVFGSHVACELARRGIEVVIAGRDLAKAEGLAHKLGPTHRAVFADVTDGESCRRALRGRNAAVNCAGPFSAFGSTLLEMCLEVGCHYADISDDRAHAGLVRSFNGRFKTRGLSAVYGCSSLPGISGALALVAQDGMTSAPVRARVTLFIGNDDRKGSAAIRSAVRVLGRRIDVPDGNLRGFRNREVVDLPAPFGPRTVYSFESPEYDLFPSLLGVRAVSVKVGFGAPMASRTFALLACISSGYGDWLARAIERLGRLLPGYGPSGGAVVTDLFWESGVARRAAIYTSSGAQRMAALPCVFSVSALLENQVLQRGAMTAYELLGAQELVGGLLAEGYQQVYAEGSTGSPTINQQTSFIGNEREGQA